MREFLVQNPMLATIFVLLIVLLTVYVVVKAMQTIGLERIREIVYHGFLEAEHEFLHGENEQKFEYVVRLAKKHLPFPFGMFITETLLRDIIQLWFDLVKDLLDDGKMNGTEGEF